MYTNATQLIQYNYKNKNNYLLLLFLIFSHFYVGSVCLMRLLHLARYYVSSFDNSFSDQSFPMVSIHLRFGLPLLLFPGTSIPITLLPTYSSSLHNTCPYHFNLLSCTFLDISPTFVVPLILSFLILSSWLNPLIHLNILISATSNFFSCAFFTAQVSAPYIIAGLTSVLPRLLLQGAAPCPLFVTPCPFEKAEMMPCPFDLFLKKYQSHMAFSSVLPFLLPTHSVDCDVHHLLSHSRALLVSSALFHPFRPLPR